MKLAEAWEVCRLLDDQDEATRQRDVERASCLLRETIPERLDRSLSYCRETHDLGVRCGRRVGHEPPHRRDGLEW